MNVKELVSYKVDRTMCQCVAHHIKTIADMNKLLSGFSAGF